MAQPFVGEIRMFGGNFAPLGWMFCEGQILAIADNSVLFALIGTTYGGDGVTTFALPDLRGRVPLHSGNTFIIGQAAGAESVTLTVQQVPVHSHPFLAAAAPGNQISPAGHVLANSFNVTPYINDVAGGDMNLNSIGAVGGSQPHSNFQPYLCVSFIISLFGIFPSQ
jgi:microcystin-dependent protein